jgi:hypothetical protein
MEIAVTLVLLVTGVVNGLPVIGVAGAAALRRLYGAELHDPDLLVLMRHRAVLLGLLGSGMAVAAFVPSWHGPAAVAGLVSMLAFVALGAGAGGGTEVRRTVVVDVVLSAALAVAAVLVLLR